ncbi:MAG: hypothetical protein ACOC3Z_02010 [Nanoarchaeota archaeon]
MVRKEGKIPCNCRVDVDYSGKKPKVKFGYPSKNPKKEAIKQAGNVYIFIIIFFIIGILPCYFLSTQTGDLNYKPTPENCGNLTYNKLEFNLTSYCSGDCYTENFTKNIKRTYGFNITCDNETYVINYENYGGYFSSHEGINNYGLFLDIVGIYIWLILSYLLSRIIDKLITKRLIKSEKYRKWFPEKNARGWLIPKISKNYRKFLPSDVFENVLIIPHFKNIELDYKTEGDFNKYLKKIRIREYRKQSINIKNKKVSKNKPKHFDWYTIFVFDKKPKKGYMEVIYQ